MNITQLEEIILNQAETFQKKQRGIPRDILFEKYISTRQITVITGVRRSGKSTLLAQFSDRLNDYYYINFDDERLLNFSVRDFETLMIAFQKRSSARTILIDEIQVIAYWERFVRRLFEEGYKIFVTGSNAKLLNSELATHLTGRYFKIELYPFSFKEYLQFQNVPYEKITSRAKASILARFDDYLTMGGFPEYIKSGDQEYLQRTYDDLLYRDLIVRFGIREVKSFKQLAQYLFTNIGAHTSYNSLAKILGLKSAMTVRNYVHMMEEAWLFFELYKYDPSLKQQFGSDKKIYGIDQGMRQAVAFTFSDDMGKRLENIVALELKRRGREIYYYKDKRECDFVVREKGRIQECLQVTQSLGAQNTERELDGLAEGLRACCATKGTVLIYEGDEKEITHKGNAIEVRFLWRWLLHMEMGTATISTTSGSCHISIRAVAKSCFPPAKTVL